MGDVRLEIRQLAKDAKALHLKERAITLESVRLVGEIVRRNVWVNLFMTSEAFAIYIGLTPSAFWKRAQAARVIRDYPEAMVMLEAGETHISHIALLASKITKANAALLLSSIRNQPKRAVEELLSRLTSDGGLLDKEPDIELRLRLTKSQMANLDRAREVLAHSGQVPSLADIIAKATEDLLDKRDPLRKAKRAAAKRAKAEGAALGQGESEDDPSEAAIRNIQEEPAPDLAALGKRAPETVIRENRPAVPAAVRHAVWLRDEGQCTWQNLDGSRCSERMMVEMDHATLMWCRGGRHDVDTLTLRCRRHNRWAADRELGAAFMASRIEQRRHAHVSD